MTAADRLPMNRGKCPTCGDDDRIIASTGECNDCTAARPYRFIEAKYVTPTMVVATTDANPT